MNARETARRLGVEYRENGPTGPPPDIVHVSFFREGDPAHSRRTRDGELMPMGPTVAELRQRIGGDEGFFVDPFGGKHHIRIPPGVRGPGWRVAIRFESYTSKV